jgi:carotenoid cleavage dioxygenase-like enzyme
MNQTQQLPSYLDNIYAPVLDERHDVDLKVEGEIPSDLCGMFVQNSPNPQFQPQGAYHWFDGDGMVHGVHFADGKAHYRNRYVQTQGFREEKQAGKGLFPGILSPFDASNPHPDKNTANTDLTWHNGKLLALWWLGGEAYELSVPDLETVGTVDFQATLSCGIAAHPKVDPITGEMMFFDYSVYQKPYLRYGVVSGQGQVTCCMDIDIPEPSLFHDIAITENYTIIPDFPMTWDKNRLAQGKRKVLFSKEKPARFGIVPRHGGEIRWFETPACYMYHTVNAWEEKTSEGETTIVVTGCRIDNPIPTVPHEQEPDIARLYFLRLHPFHYRWRFNLSSGQVTEEQLDDIPTEFPRMNDSFLGRPTRFGYHPRLAKEPTLLFDGVIKYNTDTGQSQTHSYPKNQFAGEHVYVPRPGSDQEDDGWLLAFVNDRTTMQSSLVILSAQDVDGKPLARVALPRRIPVGFHAHWAPMGG